MNELIARRLKYAREKAGLTQAQLSDKLGFKDRQTVAAIEAGIRKLSAEELLVAMKVLDVDIEYFTDSFQLVGEGEFSWRTDENVSTNVLHDYEERARRWIATYRRLGELQGEHIRPLQLRLALSEKSTYEDAQLAAEALGQEWKLGDIPARNLEKAICENLDALILYVDAPDGVSGAACQVPGLNAILINRKEPIERRHFDLAHECFHLLTWESMPPRHTEPIEETHRGKGRYKRVEQLANNFAAALLMPQEVLARLWPTRKGREINAWLVETAKGLLVSAKALKYRLKNLSWFEKTDYENIRDDKLVHKTGTRTDQTRPPRFSEVFTRRIHASLANGQLTVRRAAELLTLTIDQLTGLFQEHALTVPYDL